jgi:hypothetical protein
VRRGRHAAADGSFGRSAGSAALRGALLIAAAVVLGVVLLKATDSPEPFADISDEVEAGTTSTTETENETSSTTAAARDPAQVKVLVANGSGVQGAASRTQERLAAKDYNVIAAVNAKARVPASVVYYTEGYEAEATALAASLGDPAPTVQAMPAEPPVDDLQGASVLVVVAADLASGEGETTTTSGATSTTGG